MHWRALDQLNDKVLIIFGLGREGLSSYRFLRQHLPTALIVLYDQQPLAQLDPQWQQLINQDQLAHLVNDDSALITSSEWQPTEVAIIKTAGIPDSHPTLQQLTQAGAILLTNMTLFFALTREEQANHKSIVIIGVTGTKGKSTTTALIHHVLKQNHLPSWLGGNIGVPALDIFTEWYEQRPLDQTSYLVLELSAHQLVELHDSPDIAVVQHITPEHLDYYPDLASYIMAKSHIARHQLASHHLFYNLDSPSASEIAALSPAQKHTFSLETDTADCTVKASQIVLDAQPLMSTEGVPLRGRHNLYNVLPAVMIGSLLGLQPAQIQAAVSSFTALPHRLQLIGTVNGVEYYDDSIATNPEASIAALRAFAGQPVVLMAGGFDRGQEYSGLAVELTQHHVLGLVLLPPTGGQLLQALQQLNSPAAQQIAAVATTASNMTEAVTQAHQRAVPGAVVLLSPGAASFGLFKDYQDRGDQFKHAVAGLR